MTTTEVAMVTQVWTDGCCLKNPGGKGGWAAIVVPEQGAERVLTGGHPATTCNRMELAAIVAALEATSGPLVLRSDSRYTLDGCRQWLANWKRRGWRTREGMPVKNQDLWLEIDARAAGRAIEWCWVKGHAGEARNERCDRLAHQAAQRQRDRASGLAGVASCVETVRDVYQLEVAERTAQFARKGILRRI
jgi:ribonuclease HI